MTEKADAKSNASRGFNLLNFLEFQIINYATLMFEKFNQCSMMGFNNTTTPSFNDGFGIYDV